MQDYVTSSTRHESLLCRFFVIGEFYNDTKNLDLLIGFFYYIVLVKGGDFSES